MKTVYTKVLNDGPRNYVVRLVGYVSAGDAESLIKKVDITTLSAWSWQVPSNLILLREEFQTSNVDVSIYWEGTPNSMISVYPAGRSDTFDHMRYGGVVNNAVLPTGNVLLSTENFTDPALDGSYAITLWFRKLYQGDFGTADIIPDNTLVDELGNIWVDELGNIMVAA
jgi:hypothetical protein